MAWGWIHFQQIVIFGGTIPLKVKYVDSGPLVSPKRNTPDLIKQLMLSQISHSILRLEENIQK